MSDTQNSRLAAKAFAGHNLKALATDILIWRGGKKIPDDSKLHELAKLCAAYSTADEQYQEAERLVIAKALAQAAEYSLYQG